jgi:hypothetical protein
VECSLDSEVARFVPRLALVNSQLIERTNNQSSLNHWVPLPGGALARHVPFTVGVSHRAMTPDDFFESLRLEVLMPNAGTTLAMGVNSAPPPSAGLPNPHAAPAPEAPGGHPSTGLPAVDWRASTSPHKGFVALAKLPPRGALNLIIVTSTSPARAQVFQLSSARNPFWNRVFVPVDQRNRAIPAKQVGGPIHFYRDRPAWSVPLDGSSVRVASLYYPLLPFDLLVRWKQFWGMK